MEAAKGKNDIYGKHKLTFFKYTDSDKMLNSFAP